MAKVVTEHDIDEITCPGCKANIQIEREKPTHKIIEHDHSHDDGVSERLNKLEQMLMKKEEPEKPEVKKHDYVPPYIEKFKCKGCGKLHPNENYEGPVIGKCDTCGEKFTKKRKGKCTLCKEGTIEPFEDDDVERYDEDEDDE